MALLCIILYQYIYKKLIMKFQSDLFNFITPVVVDKGRFFIDEMFQRKFRSNGPDNTNHLIAFYNNNGHFIPVSYLSFLPYKNVLLVGGGMTDGKAIRLMSEEERNIISENNGVLYFMLKYGFEHFSNQCDAYFGHVNDPRALEVDLAAGFEKTIHQYLVVNYHKPTSQWKKKRLAKMISKIGAF